MKNNNTSIRPMLRGYRSYIIVFCCGLILTACSNYPLEDAIRGKKASLSEISSANFRHKLIRAQRQDNALTPLLVFIEGDGKPWLHSKRIALDPTPKYTPMLELMLNQQRSSIYLGRPCYFYTDDSNCSPRMWTRNRYSEAIVQSMNVALDIANIKNEKLVLVGHSGGGTLAMLMAASRQDVTALITISANLDIENWAQHHSYSALSGSLNPVDLDSLPASIKQAHFVGANDKNITPTMLRNALRKQKHANITVIPEADHDCCWGTIWPAVFKEALSR